MTKKSMSYDHPAYLVREIGAVTALAGNANLTAKYVAFTNMLLKSATIVVVVAGTSTGAAGASTGFTFSIHGTATTSVGYAQFGSAAAYVTTTNIILANGTKTLLAGEVLEAKSGSDAVIVADVAYEMVILPGADVTSNGD